MYQVLGRANEVSAFVKDQHDSGYTEIELKGKPGKGNLTIGRTLFANKKSTAFTLNGKTATGKEVNEKIAELNIQISNLW
jgi:chromosome segregation ATPase